MKEHRQSRIIFWDECPSFDGDGTANLLKPGSGNVYRSQEEFFYQDELLNFPLVFRYVFGKRVIPGRA